MPPWTPQICMAWCWRNQRVGTAKQAIQCDNITTMANHGYRGAGSPNLHRPIDEAARTIVPRALLYLRPYWLPFAFVLLCVLIISGIGVIPPLLIRHIIDRALPERDLSLLYGLVAAMVGLAIAGGLVGVLQSYLNNIVSQRIMFDLRNELYGHLQELSLRFFTTNRTGEIMSRRSRPIEWCKSTSSC